MSKVLFTSHVANFSKFNRPFMQLLKDKGYEVHYASMGEEEVNDCDKHFDITFERNPLKLNNIRAIRQLKKIIDTEKYDIIHTHTPVGAAVTRIAARNARKHGTRIIYTAHGFHFFNGAPMLNWLIYYPMERLLAKLTDILITINQEDYIRAKRFPTNKVYRTDGIGVNLDKFKASSVSKKHRIRTKYGYKDDDFILLCVAEFTKNKNQRFLIKTFEELIKQYPNIKIIFAGKGAEFESCLDLCENLNLKDSVRMLGYRKDVDQLYSLADVLVSASHREGLPVNIIEAMASGLPIVCTNIRGCHDLVKENINGYLYNTDDSQAYIHILNKLITNKIILDEISQNNIQESKKYSLLNIKNTMEYIYDEAN